MNGQDLRTSAGDQEHPSATHLSGDRLYWTTATTVVEGSLDGSSVRDIARDRPRPLDVTTFRGSVYWIESDPYEVDGSVLS